MPNVTWTLPRNWAGNIPVQRAGHDNDTLFFWAFEHEYGSFTAAANEACDKAWAIWLNGCVTVDFSKVFIILTTAFSEVPAPPASQAPCLKYVILEMRFVMNVPTHVIRFRMVLFTLRMIGLFSTTITAGINWWISCILTNLCMMSLFYFVLGSD